MTIQRSILKSERALAHFTAKKGRLHVTVYENGPKALVQGNEAREFARDVLEPMVIGGAVEGGGEGASPAVAELRPPRREKGG